MFHLLEFLRKYHYIFLFLLLECVAFKLLFNFNSYQGSVWLSSANSVVASINSVNADLAAYFHLRTANEALTEMNVRLQLENELLREQIGLSHHDTIETTNHLLHHLSDYELIPALVTSNTQVGENRYIVMNRGTNNGVKEEMGVVSGTGIVGVVYLVGPNYSLVMPAYNKRASISCRVKGQSYFGYLQWDENDTRKAYVDDIQRYAKIKTGDTIETSGFSSVFPPGIFVGTIHGIENSADGQSFRLSISPNTDFSSLRYVNIIATPYRAELDTLRAKAAIVDQRLNN